ncbi:hypothetical protein [Sphingomonas sp. 1P08PE]|uniref:hypothetical protein n=1 Tax=Sphingomonas sp. 1P08PE TaxID=554122 RepID=UPI0039A109CC
MVKVAGVSDAASSSLMMPIAVPTAIVAPDGNGADSVAFTCSFDSRSVSGAIAKSALADVLPAGIVTRMAVNPLTKSAALAGLVSPGPGVTKTLQSAL